MACPRCPWRGAPAVRSQGHGHLGPCHWLGPAFGDLGLWWMELDAEHVNETQSGFALGPASVNCGRCFAATQQFVIKAQLAILI